MDINKVLVGMSEQRAAIEAGRKVFGEDFNLLIARCPAWGGDDVCLLVYGKQHALAALAFTTEPGATVEEQTSCAWRGRPAYTYSVVTIPVAREPGQ